MNLRGRLIGAATALTLVTLGGAFASVFVTVNRAQVHRLDHALIAQADDEARHVARATESEIRTRPGPFANGVGPLTRYGVIYTAQGVVLDTTPTFDRAVPTYARVHRAPREHFDLWFHGVHLRAVFVPVPDESGRRLLLAIPRADVDGDEAFLRRAMLLVFAAAVGWAVVMTTWLVRRLTREHQAITEAVTRVAQGDLTARVAAFAPGGQVEPLGHAVDDMISRMDRLVTSQQRFVAHAAHELRLPLTTLLGELSLALRKDREETAYREAIEQALGDTRRLKLLADDLLTLARIGSAPERPMATLALRDVAFGALELVRASAKARGVSLGVDGDGRVMGHAADLKRLVQNLLENAVRHSPEGAPVRVIIREDADGVTLRVRDQGDGVPDDDRDQIFEPFYRASGHRDDDDLGAGLGLSIVREIARAHGGEVALEPPDPDRRGATFSLRLPRA